MKPKLNCRFFSGAKPCGLSQSCDESCKQFQARGRQILLVHLGALGAVVRSTALLGMIHEKYPDSQITWVTQSPAQNLLKDHPRIHRVLTTSENHLLVLSTLKFEVALVVDKSLDACGILNRTKVDQVFGFTSDDQGVILPATNAAQELWEIGISDQLKFKVNRKTEIQLMAEALELPYRRQDYDLPLLPRENDVKAIRYQQWSHGGQRNVVGLNTGCAHVIAAKKLSIENHRELIRKLQKHPSVQIVLLGGPEDTERNYLIAQGMKDVIISPTREGLRDGLISVAACEVVITGDSLGMHMAISQKRHVVAWFGPTCSWEIELYGRGHAIQSQAPCGPCWKRSCHKPVMCYDLVNLDEIVKRATENFDSNSSADRLLGGSAFSRSTFDLG